ncbi:unnamed protein product [Caenorhabditis sp. 36 PRJEB53466]|nr:unnamed protein product [Caenorhabditis sp. 36 PRJEB53466]
MAEQLRKDIAAKKAEHEKKLREERREHAEKVKGFSSQLDSADDVFTKANRQKNNDTEKHEEQMRKLTAANEAANKASQSLHEQTLSGRRKETAAELDALRQAQDAREKDQIAYQSEEKQWMEETKRRANEDAIERITIEKEQTNRAQELAAKSEKERIEYAENTEKSNLAEIGEMKKALLETTREESQREIEHHKQISAIENVGILAQVGMDKAAEQMQMNRSAYDAISQVTDEINTSARKFSEISSKIRVAAKFNKADHLKKQYAGIIRSLEAFKTSQANISRMITELIEKPIDDKDNTRQATMRLALEDVDNLTDFFQGLQLYADPKVSDENFLKETLQIVEGHADHMDSLKSNWNNLPPVDRTNLVHAQFMATTELLLSGQKLAVETNGSHMIE